MKCLQQVRLFLLLLLLLLLLFLLLLFFLHFVVFEHRLFRPLLLVLLPLLLRPLQVACALLLPLSLALLSLLGQASTLPRVSLVLRLPFFQPLAWLDLQLVGVLHLLLLLLRQVLLLLRRALLLLRQMVFWNLSFHPTE